MLQVWVIVVRLWSLACHGYGLSLLSLELSALGSFVSYLSEFLDDSFDFPMLLLLQWVPVHLRTGPLVVVRLGESMLACPLICKVLQKILAESEFTPGRLSQGHRPAIESPLQVK